MNKAGKAVFFGLMLAFLLVPVVAATPNDALTVTYYYMPG